jgi:transcriptional regulator with XRE-family HTH domain
MYLPIWQITLTILKKLGKLYQGGREQMINVGKRIRELRKKKGLTLLELSKKSGVALATLSRMETGKMTGTFESHVSISKALDLSLPEFYSELDKPTTLQKDGDYGDLFVHDKKATSVILSRVRDPK